MKNCLLADRLVFRSSSVLLCSGVLLVCLFAGAPLAADLGNASIVARDSGNGDAVALPSGTVIHRANGVVSNLRTIDVGDNALQLFLWDEKDANGQPRSFYAVGQGGSELKGRVRETSYQIELAQHRFDPLSDSAPSLHPLLVANADNNVYLVQTMATPLPEMQAQMKALGASIHRYITNHTMVVTMNSATKDSVSGLPFVRWVGNYHPAYRVDATVRALIQGQAADDAPQRYSIMLLERGLDRQSDLGSTIAAIGGTVEVTTKGGFRMEATLTRDQVLSLVQDNRVQFIDPWGGPAETDMDIVREVGGGNYVETVGGFTGTGVRGEIFDTETLTTHQEWANTPIVHSPGTAGSLHGTSCASNVFAQGTSAAARGMAPDGTMIVFRGTDSTQFGGAISRYTILEELLDPLGPYQGVFQTSSIGSARNTTYSSISAETDDYLHLHQVLSTQSQSNSGSTPSRPQAWAKNIVSVGGFRHFGTADRSDDSHGSSGSTGPAADGRIKPDLSFFYDGIFSASGSSPTSYTSFGGTSSATPQTAGHFALMYQMWHEGVWEGHGGGASVFDSHPHMATAKALVIHEAHRYDWNVVGPNSDLTRVRQGWGTADLRNLYDNAPITAIIDGTEILGPGDTYSTTVSIGVADGAPTPLKATLSYVDPMGTVGAAVARINDLTLRVTSPTGTIYWGNNGMSAGNVSTSGGSSNTIDTVEVVVVENPEVGDWTVEVLADEIVQDAHLATPEVDAIFGLIVSPASSNEIFTDGFESGTIGAWSFQIP